MKSDFEIEKIVRTRSSVRTYEERPLSLKVKEQIKAYIDTLSNPFSVDVSFQFLETKSMAKGERLGTYGVIKGAKDYIGATVTVGDLSLEALGYSFEKLILYMTSLGIGTCWLAGTFNRSQFTNAMGVKENEQFPAITAIGYPLGKKSLTDTIIRKIAKSDQRKDWSKIFFKNDFSHPLDQETAEKFSFPLDMVRLAPSASNKQPWRIVQSENAFHFFEAKTPGYSERHILDIQRVDIGIAACHFHLAALEKGLSGRFEKISPPVDQLPENIHYIVSFILD